MEGVEEAGRRGGDGAAHEASGYGAARQPDEGALVAQGRRGRDGPGGVGLLGHGLHAAGIGAAGDSAMVGSSDHGLVLPTDVVERGFKPLVRVRGSHIDGVRSSAAETWSLYRADVESFVLAGRCALGIWQPRPLGLVRLPVLDLLLPADLPVGRGPSVRGEGCRAATRPRIGEGRRPGGAEREMGHGGGSGDAAAGRPVDAHLPRGAACDDV
mmetsp:Transcript_135509/g.433462  ORF Transcript_135509/g.433462 Transcript_135509/m.433462 type:complete len:213 (+) Transcript_135509:103-741(+)